MAHPWMSRGSSLPFGPAPFPNKITSDEIADEIVKHMVNMLKVRFLMAIMSSLVPMIPPLYLLC